MKRKARKESRQRAEKESRYSQDRRDERSPQPGTSQGSNPSRGRSGDRSASRSRGEDRGFKTMEGQTNQKSGWEASLKAIRKIPFVGEASLDAIRVNLLTPKSNPVDLIMREPHTCSAEDVKVLVQESKDHGWISMTQQAHGRFLLFCSPLGSIVVLHSTARAYLLPEALSRLMRDEFVHKVCIDSLEIAELLKRAKLRIASLVDARSMAAYHKEELVTSDLDGEIYTIDERDRPYSNPALFKAPCSGMRCNA